MKKCKDCGNTKPIIEFYGVQGECKECSKKRIKKYSISKKKKCIVCGKEFGTCITEIKRGGGKYCSRICFYKHNSGANTYNWKGNKASYHAIHNWVKRKLGTPSKCSICKATDKKMYHWANISGKYIRKLEDWKRVCVSCHKKMDEKLYNKRCVICNKKIITKSQKRKFCSKSCSSKYYRNK